jgi:hypothetical protein
MLAALLAVVCLLAGAATASAQKDSVLVLGAAASIYHSTDAQVENPWGFGLVARLRRNSGVGVTIGLNWVSATVNQDIGGEPTRLGKLIVRPLMAGVVYTRQYAHFAVAGSLVAGYSFNGLRDTGQAADAYASRLGQPGATFAVNDSFVYRPAFSIWWELGNRFGLMTSVAYLATQPEIVTMTTEGTVRHKVSMNAPLFTVGIGYGIF